MRIIAGKYRAKKLTAPDGTTTRPTSDRAREAVFSMLDSKLRKNGVSWSGLVILDVFAGTGAMGIEALSRGAKVLFAAEKDPAAVRCFYQNADSCIKDGLQVCLFPDALDPPPARVPAAIVFMDPPYNQGLVAPALEILIKKGWIDRQTVCVIEIARHEQNILPVAFETTDCRVYGKAEILFARLR